MLGGQGVGVGGGGGGRGTSQPCRVCGQIRALQPSGNSDTEGELGKFIRLRERGAQSGKKEKTSNFTLKLAKTRDPYMRAIFKGRSESSEYELC